MVHLECYATIGQVGNLNHENVSIGKAGRSLLVGRRPTVRGVVMNPTITRMAEGKEDLGRPAPGQSMGAAHERLQNPEQ